MESFDIQGKLRKDLGKKETRNLRKQGFVPCEMYGGKENIHFYTDEKSFKKIIYTANVYLVHLDLDGKKHQAILHMTQFDPVTDQLIHADFIEISDDKKVTMKIPVKVTGNAIGVRNGGKLRLAKRYLKLKALPKYLPDFIEIDTTNLEIGDGVKVKDLTLTNIEPIDPEWSTVVSVITSRISKSMQEAEVPGVAAETGAEGESAEQKEKEGAESKEK